MRHNVTGEEGTKKERTIVCGACIAVERDEKTKYIGRGAALGCATQVCVCFFFLVQCMDGIAAQPHTTRN